MNELDLTIATNETVTHQAKATAEQINTYLQQVKFDKMQLLHQQESHGSRNEIIEQEQEKQEQNSKDESEYDCDFIHDTSRSVIDSNKDMFEGMSVDDNEIVNSVLQDLEGQDVDDEEDEAHYPPNEFTETSDLF